MGQKTNPNILRLGITKHWKTEFFEKKKKELPLYIYKDLEIQSYIERFLESKGILVYDYNQFYSNNTLNLYISFFVSYKFCKSQKIPFANLKSKTNDTRIKKSPFTYSLSTYLNNFHLTHTIFLKKDKTTKLIRLKKLYRFKSSSLKVNKFKNWTSKLIYSVTDNYLIKMFQVILGFTTQKFDILINLSCINKDCSYLKILKKRKVSIVRRFKNVLFFKQDGFELLCYVVFNKNSARLLAKFISLHLKVVKRPMFLLSCVKKTLKVLMSLKKRATVKGVKIILKGRLRRGPRAKHKQVILGDVPVQTIDSNIDYFQTTTHNSKGSYGIKVWVVYK
jgi:Ribosomal protein S3, C-terminal domain